MSNDPMVRFIRDRADSLAFQARTHRSPEVIALYGEATATRMALGAHVAAKELRKVAEAVERGDFDTNQEERYV